MWDINTQFDLIGERRDKISFLIKSNKSIDPFYNFYPIKWSGLIGSMDIEIQQESEDSEYNFIKYPAQYSNLKGEIIRCIENYINEKCA